MAGETIATARIDLEFNTRDYELTVDRAKNKLSDFSTEAQSAYQRLETSQRNATDRLLNYVRGLERSAEAQRLYTAAARDVPQEIWTEAAARIDAVRLATEMAEAETRAWADAMEEAARWNAEFDKHRANIGAEHADEQAALQARRRADATEALTIALLRQEAAEDALRNAEGWAAEEERANLAWRRAEATDALTLALQREEAAEEALRGQADFERQQQAAQLAWRRAEATQALTTALEQQEAAERNASWIKNLERQTAVLGMSTSELLEYEAAERGLQAQAAPLIQAFREKEKAIRGQNAAMQQGKKWNDEYGMSQKQLEFAMRGLPAQFTDIFISLQGGQNPLTVFLQQGGQIKDMFGGIANAARVMAGELAKALTNPYLAGAAAIGLFAYGLNKAQQNQFDFAKAIIQTGNYVDTTVSELEALVVTLDQIEGVTRGQAREGLLAVASSGRIAADQFERVGEVVTRVSSSMGISAEDTVKKFERIADKPVEALLELNKREHFLTETQYARIAALEEEGDQQALVAEAMEIYAQHLERADQQARDAMPFMQRKWGDVKDSISEAWGELQTYFDLLGRVIERHGDLGNSPMPSGRGFTANIMPSTSLIPDWATNSALIGGLTKNYLGSLAPPTAADVQFAGIYARDENGSAAVDTIAIEAQRKRNEEAKKERERADKEWARVVEQGLDDRERQLAREAEIIALGEQLGKAEAEVQAQVAASRAKFEESQSRRNRGGRGDENARQREALSAFKNRLDEENATLKAQTEAVKAEYSARGISLEQYYDRLIQLAGQEFEVFERSAQAQIAFLRTQENSAQNRMKIAELESQINQRRIESGAQAAKLEAERDRKVRDEERSLRDYVRALEERTTALARQQEVELIGIGLSQREAELLVRITQLYQEQADVLMQLQEQRERENWSPEQYEARIAAVRGETERQVQILRDGYDAMTRARGDIYGAWNSSVRDFTDEAGNLAGQTREVFGTVTGGITDMFLEMRRTGKATIGDLGDALADLLIRFGTNQILSWMMGMWGPASAPGTSIKSLNVKPNALGGVYDSPSLSSYSNSVVNQPTVFAFAKGAGLMGEAGPEAIMPLGRDASGKLGVQALGASAGGGGMPKLTVNVYGAPGTPQTQISEDGDGGLTLDVIFDQLEQRQARNIMQGTSPVNQALTGRYVLQER